MKLSLPYPPSANRLWRNWRGRMVLSTEGRSYKQGVKLRALTQGCLRPLEGPVVVFVTAYRPRRNGDLDNALKALLDALKGVAFVDDDQVVELHAMRLDDKADPRVVVTIEAIDQKFALKPGQSRREGVMWLGPESEWP